VIVKARAGTGGPALARYLEQGKNDHAELLELRNMDAPSLKAALYRMDDLAKGSRCQKHALHVQMRAAPGERLSAAHWREAVNRYAQAFGLQEHQTAVVLHHQPDGATHCHAVFNRVHPETLKAAHLSKNYETHKTLARDLEREWGLRQVGDQTEGRNYSDRGRGEQEQAQRVGENVHEIRAQIRGAWDSSEDGQSFVHILAAYGFRLAKGDRRDFVAVDRHGNPYSLGKRTTGASAQEVRERLADIGPVLPLEGVRLLQREAAERQQREAEDIRQKEAEKGRDLPQTTQIRGASRPDRAGLPQRPTQRPPPSPQSARRGLPSRPASPKAESAPEPTAQPAQTWNEHQEKRERVTRYYATDTIRRKVWEEAAAARIARMQARHTRELERQRETLEANARLGWMAKVVQRFNDQQRQELTRVLLKRQDEELEAERQRQQARRDKWDAWAGRALRAAEYAEQTQRLEAQRKQREAIERRYRGGFKTRLREDLTAMRQNPDHIGASNPHDPARQARPEVQREATPEAKPSGKTRAERRAEELRQQTQGQERTRRRPPRKPGPI
jgi:hypothetical protein